MGTMPHREVLFCKLCHILAAKQGLCYGVTGSQGEHNWIST